MLLEAAERIDLSDEVAGRGEGRVMSIETRADAFADLWLRRLGSLRLAVVIMTALGVACAWATFHEASYGTASAQRLFYQAPWFTALLLALAVNITASMLLRFPWSRHNAGFLLAHAGILILLLGSLISLHRGIDGSMGIYERETTDRVSLRDRSLHVALPGAVHASFDSPAAGAGPQRLPIGEAGDTLVIEEVAAHAVVGEELVEAAQGGWPTLHLQLAHPTLHQDAWLSLESPDAARMDFGPVAFTLARAETPEHAQELLRPQAAGRNEMRFVAGPNGGLAWAISSAGGSASEGSVVLDQPIPTPWMGISISVDRFLPRATRRRSVEPAPAPVKEEQQNPAIRAHLEGQGRRSDSFWLAWNDLLHVAYAGGEATLAFRPSELTVPFRVTLLEFRSEKYPGSNRPASYESRVRVEDPERGVSEHLIAMNRPLHYRGYVFFQSSFVEGEPMLSIFSVVRAPGLPLVYLGTLLISLGSAWMFYLKPWLAKRQARRALEAHMTAAQAAVEASAAARA
ncbi:MAG: cytochrome c biogenesis protein ResB [Vicinamibacteria bacterium]